MTELERRYRSLLRVLPRPYRETWADDMVATFLQSMATDDVDGAEFVAEFGKPNWAEVVSVMALAIRLRLGGEGSSARYFAWGTAVRLVVLVGLLVNALLASASVELLFWDAGSISWLPVPGGVSPADPLLIAGNLAGLLWLVAFFATVFGHRRAAAIFGSLAVVPGIVAAVSATMEWAVNGGPGFVLAMWVSVVVNILLMLALMAFHQDAAAVSHRPWLLALGVGVVVNPLPIFAVLTPPDELLPLDWPGLCTWAVVVVALVYLVVPAVRSPARSLALALLVAIAFVLRAVTVLDAWFFFDSAPTGLHLTELAVLVVVGVSAAMFAGQWLRRLPQAV
jgi:hypothetical protein